MSAGVVSLLPGPFHSITSAPLGSRNNPKSIPRKAIIPAALTPIDEDGKIDFADFRRHISDLADVHGVSAIMVNGASGHGSTLSREEKRKLLGEALAVVGDRIAILAAVKESEAVLTLSPLAKDAQSEGAHALTIMPPDAPEGFSWEFANKRFEAVLSACSLPLAIYQTKYDTETLVRLADFPTVFAVKEGSVDPSTFERNMRALRALDKEIAVWSTHSKWLLADLAIGADGILSGMGSVAADLQVALAEAVERSDLATARQINERIFPLAQVFYGPGQDPHVRMKYALKRLGRQKFDFMRPPFQALIEAECAAIDRALKQSGI